MADLRQRKKVVPEKTFDGLKAGLAKVSQRLTPHRRLASDPKVRKLSIRAVSFAVFIDCICSAVLRPNYPAMVGMFPNPEQFPADTKHGIKANLAMYLIPGCTALGSFIAGMVLAPLDDKALVRPVETAGKADIPVVIIDSGLQTDKYASFVSTDNALGGRMGGARLGKLLGGKGNVLLLRYAVGSASTTKREQGFLDEIKENFPGIEVLSSDQYAGATRDLAYTASQNLLSRYGNEVNGIFCPNESVTVSMTKAVRDIGKAGGMVKIIGFDTSVQSLRDLKSGDVAGLVVQNPVKMGYLGVMTLVEHLGGKAVDKRIDTGVALITSENMSEPDMQELLNPPLEKYLGTGN